MAIVISNNGENAKKIEKSSFDNEDYLQNYIENNPDSIPLYDIKEDIRLLVVAREFRTESGFIDALGIDIEGNIYVIETKLFKNPDKRQVVAQALDYGAALWKDSNFEYFKNSIETNVKDKFNVSFAEKLIDFYGVEENEVNNFLENMRRNLKDGNCKFVLLMDKLDFRLKDLIVYINQNSEFDIYAVELEYYKYETYEIIIPKIFGAEVKKNIPSSNKSKSKTYWDLESFSRKLRSEFGDPEVEVVKNLLSWSENNGLNIYWQESQIGGFVIGVRSAESGKEFYPFSIRGNGEIIWNAPHQYEINMPQPFNDLLNRKQILEKLKSVSGAIVNVDKITGYSALKLKLRSLSDQKAKDSFFNILLWIKKEVDSPVYY